MSRMPRAVNHGHDIPRDRVLNRAATNGLVLVPGRMVTRSIQFVRGDRRHCPPWLPMPSEMQEGIFHCDRPTLGTINDIFEGHFQMRYSAQGELVVWNLVGWVLLLTARVSSALARVSPMLVQVVACSCPISSNGPPPQFLIPTKSSLRRVCAHLPHDSQEVQNLAMVLTTTIPCLLQSAGMMQDAHHTWKAHLGQGVDCGGRDQWGKLSFFGSGVEWFGEIGRPCYRH